ncbi:MAG: hypothetical protein GTO45_21095, partial [Candidatus Aminicenantes bacterium]|nr:hypothetical protein [Candidatus Aminicenantes bacterium]NIM81262.1 hypothetical protein [Candidatus Aminicenantes bacterium]NIN20661.1 hypothetical protein [Candidatus Aminicenantes bacterium]NIN44440.1 hypothetical protein [Candidatus Aminicenantes bacterium]NIN87259.1 hypothetical protein [Candidatus Aminicenantes bacterium]
DIPYPTWDIFFPPGIPSIPCGKNRNGTGNWLIFICLIVCTDGRLVGVDLTPTGRFVAPWQANLGPAQPNLGLTQAKLGLAQPNLGLAQAKLGLAQPNLGLAQAKLDLAQPNLSPAQAKLGLAQPNLGLAQAKFAEHKQFKLSESIRNHRLEKVGKWESGKGTGKKYLQE